MYRQMWKFDEDGNYTSIRQGHVYCNHCKDVKQIIETVLTERVHWTYSQFIPPLQTLLAIFIVLYGLLGLGGAMAHGCMTACFVLLYWGMGIGLV